MSREVTRFSRHARRHPKWDMGRPPGRPRRPRRRLPLGRWVLFGAVGALAALPVSDRALGWVKPGLDCRVAGIVDGDTVRVRCDDGTTGSGRVLGYDTPELSARCPREAWGAFVAGMQLRGILWRAGRIDIRRDGEDRYGRMLIDLRADGRSVAGRMIAGGWARSYDGGMRRPWCNGAWGTENGAGNV
ncbi:thermonuclease family protein [Aestuariicoccus sp. MJ-SS9]|uniref:thermonuclease family protein n=1 Tax=Aestuariicoccus sp. MJ-SS9 TaxID=3079855 RepID=UPI0029069DA6|nr:thermonuclease family protein [Aestuariicoccus sp. MJ-SS9]MDU8910540.1 thermonuclease family protein [Aestuariicoccus sp. MJ-SS9]